MHEADGMTSGGPSSISNEQFVNEVAQRLLSALSVGSAIGPLYSVDARLRPHGASGPLVQTLAARSIDYYRQTSQTWERMSLTRARVIFATGGFGERVTEAVRSILTVPVERAKLAVDVLAMRRKLEAARPRHDLKRGAGGLADVEFIVQFLQLLHVEQPAGLAAVQHVGRPGGPAPASHHHPERAVPICAMHTSFCAPSRAACGSSIIEASPCCRRTLEKSSDLRAPERRIDRPISRGQVVPGRGRDQNATDPRALRANRRR